MAVASKRDSSAMKTIAALTMFFLPATFVAVSIPKKNIYRPLSNLNGQAFFSMPLFDWNGETGERPGASPLIWMYWVITVPLTAILFVGWHVWSKFEEKASEAELEAARKEDKDRISGSI